MSRQDKATTEKHAKMLREMLKRPDNKVCADCKRNDPRWASWNIGVFLCIRCSGVHRSMGTHISKVKSVDLDVWTLEQMASIQKWGNRLANLYWEGHLKAGHVPADHKMESFIRSKYESRRWALEGPPPSDPLVLENVAASHPSGTAPATSTIPAPQVQSSYSLPAVSAASATATRSSITTRQPQPRQLLSAGIANRNSQPVSAPTPTTAQAAPPAPAQPNPAEDLFSLDFHPPSNNSPAPSQAASPPPKKDVKQDILSLFSSSAPAPAAAAPAFGGYAQAQPDPGWGSFASASPQPPTQPTSMMGNAGVGMWGASSGWTSPAAAQPPATVWSNATSAGGAPQIGQQSMFNTSDVWGSSASSGAATGDLFGSTAAAPKKDDPFGDIWGGFK